MLPVLLLRPVELGDRGILEVSGSLDLLLEVRFRLGDLAEDLEPNTTHGREGLGLLMKLLNCDHLLHCLSLGPYLSLLDIPHH